MTDIRKVSDYLAAHEIRPSYSRVRIMQYLLEYRSHPTIDEIHRALAPGMPTLSKTTVYNTLALFIRHGVAQPLTIEEKQTRYDADTTAHGHFQCDACGRVFDFSVDSFAVHGLEGFAVGTRSFFFRGLCPDCRKQLPATGNP
jgi:Fe2+ or Zn2+ uptake regulation protein